MKLFSIFKKVVKKKKNPKVWHDTLLPGYGFHFAICLNEKEFLETLEYLGIKGSEDFISPGKNATVHCYIRDHQEINILCIDPTQGTVPQVAALLAHEATHVMDNFMGHIGEEQPSFEFKAYFIQDLVLSAMERAYKKCQ